MSDDQMEFKKSVDGATEAIAQHLFRQTKLACVHVEGEAKRDCPVDQGILRASLSHDVQMTKDGIEGRIGSNLEYAPYVHQGTGVYAVEGNGRKTPWKYTVKSGKYKGEHWTIGQKPQPFLKNAMIRNKEVVNRLLAR